MDVTSKWGHKKHCVASVLLLLGSLALGGCQLPRQEQAALWRGLSGGERGPPSSHQEELRPPDKSTPGSLEGDPPVSSVRLAATLPQNILMTTSRETLS